MFRERFNSLLAEKGVTAHRVARATGIPGGSVNQYKNGVSVPNRSNAMKIAEYLQCSVGYLFGETDEREISATVNKISVDFKRLESLRVLNGVTVSFLCSAVDKRRGYINDCREKKSRVPIGYVKKWADILGTTPEYLSGETDEMGKPATVNICDGLSEKQVQLINQIRAADDDAVDLLLRLASLIIHGRPDE